MNTRLEYLYRDGSNYKQHHEVVMQGGISEDDLRPLLWEHEFFRPSAVGLPDLQHRFREQGYAFPNEDDHPWHEIESVAATEDPPTVDVTAAAFLSRMRACHVKGWEHFSIRVGMRP